MQSHPTVKKAPRRELSNQSSTLELTNGKVTSLMGLSNNQISSNYHLSNNIVLRLILKLLNPCPLILMFSILLIIAIPKSEAYPLEIYISEFALILLILVVKEFYFDIIRNRADEKVNKRELLSDSKVFRDGSQLSNLCWGDIKQGDILYLQKGEKAPADLIILDTQYIQDRQAVVYINTRSVTGKVTVERKKACYLTQVNTRSAVKRNWQKYKKEYLTGKLKYESSNANIEDFLGYLKLVKDPKTSLISFQNFILRESIIKTCWIYGLVVNSGMDCKIIKHIGQKNKNNYNPINTIDRIFQIGIVINIILGLPFALLTISNSGITIIQNFSYHIMIFTLFLPTFLYIGFQLLMLTLSFYNNIDAQITNFSNIINLGSIDYAFISYNGVLSSGKMIVDEIITASSLYDFKDQVLQVPTKKAMRRNGSLSDSGSGSSLLKDEKSSLFLMGNKKNNKFFEHIYNNNCISNQSPYLSADIVQTPNEMDTYFIDDDYKQDTNNRIYSDHKHLANNKFHIHLQPLRINKEKLTMNIKNQEEESIEMVIAFGLCHQAIIKSFQLKFQANSRVYSEQILLKLVNNIGIYLLTQIDLRTKKQVGIKVKIQEDDAKEWFYSRKINRFDDDKKIFSVVVRKEGSEDRILYCKGSPEDLLQKIKNKELKKNIIQNKLLGFKNSKSQIIIYGKRTMSHAEYEIYDAEYTKLKSSFVTQKDIDEFSAKFQKDLQFVCMVGLTSVKNEAAKETVQYLQEKGIKMCVFANQFNQIQTLKTLLNNPTVNAQYVELSGINGEELTYNLNSIIRKLNSQKKYNYSIILGKQCWNMLNANSSLIHHFLFIAYYANNILAYGFSSADKAEIAKKIKNNHIKSLSVLSIGSSYSDILFLNESDVSMITSSCDGQILPSDIPSQIKTSNISNLKHIIQFGSWVNKVYNNLIEVSIYRSVLIGTVSFVMEIIIYYYERTSYNFNGKLAGLYIIVYGIIETIFLIKLQYTNKKKKVQLQTIQTKKLKIDFVTNIIQGFIHGSTITIIVMKTLPNARLAGGKLFPIQALHFSIYLLLICVSIFRHKIRGTYTFKAIIGLTLTSFICLFGILWIGYFIDKEYYKLAIQMVSIWTCYDSAAMILNILIFCLASTLFIVEQKKNNMIKTIFKYYTSKKQQKIVENSKSIMNKDPDYIELVRHLFKQEENIQQSINQLVGAQLDTNQFKLTHLLQIKKMQHQIKHQFINVQLNLQRFKITMLILSLLFLSEIFHILIIQAQNQYQMIPFVIGLVLIIIGYLFLLKVENIGRNYYKIVEIFICTICGLYMIYECIKIRQSSQLLVISLIFNITTQLIGIRLLAVLLVQTICYLIWFILSLSSYNSNSFVFLEIILTLGCAIINFSILYKNILGSKKNFILREQIQMQTNQTNDIWTILVPEFVRNFFAQNGQQGGQYKEDSVAILFCYVCNFDSIIQQQQRNVVRILDDLYRQFDKLCSTFAVQKIQTVGYTYMAATGIKKIQNQMEVQMVKKNKVERLVNMGQQMIEKTKLFKWGVKKNKDLDIKIGIHVGGVVVGVIGKHKKQFSLIGTNVNTTSRHGSTGGNRSICLSKQARAELPNYPDKSFLRKDVYMKGLCKSQTDTIPVYLLKVQQAGKRMSKSNGYRLKFKQLVLKVIRSNRLNDNQSSEDGDQIMTQFINIAQEPHRESVYQSRDTRKRTTCQGLQNNFNKIQEMKNRKDEIKCYSKLLQFDKNQAKDYFQDCYPRKKIEQINKMVYKQEQLDQEYLLDLQKHKGSRDKLLLLSLLILNIILFIANVVYLQNPLSIIILRVVGIIFTIILIWLSSFFGKYPIITYVFAAIFIYQLSVEKISFTTNQSQDYNPLSHFYIMMILTIYSGVSSIRFINVSILGIIAILFDLIITCIKGLSNMNPIYQWLYIIYIIVRKYSYQKESIINFRQRKQTAHISNELSKIVSELLPKHAYQKLKTQNFQNRLELTDLFEQCTILFADIKGFTQFSDRPQNRKQPQNVVKMLRSLFQQFDVLCTEKKVYKVYTIGDCYVVLGFTNCYDRNPIKQAQNVVSFAFDMIRKIEQVKRAQPELSCLNMRIGVHTGTIIGGIVGTQIVRYDIYGSDVVVANKFQETGKVGQVHISEETKKLLDQLQKKPYSQNNIYPSGKVEVKKLNISYGGYFIKLGNLS